MRRAYLSFVILLAGCAKSPTASSGFGATGTPAVPTQTVSSGLGLGGHSNNTASPGPVVAQVKPSTSSTATQLASINLSSLPAARKASTIHIGMDFDQAAAKLSQYKAEPFLLQSGTISSSLASRLGGAPVAPVEKLVGDYYILPSGFVLLVLSKPGKSGQTVASFSVSTYSLKPWTSKTDPERDNFFQSFVGREEYDLQSPGP